MSREGDLLQLTKEALRTILGRILYPAGFFRYAAGMDLWQLCDLCTPWCIHVVATLRIADHLAAGMTKIDQLAAASSVDPDSLHRVLRHLVAKGVSKNRNAATSL